MKGVYIIMKETLKVENVKKTFKLTAKQQKEKKVDKKILTAVDGLSFSAYEGEIFGLLGPNGAGKTTTLRMLATLLRPTSGDAFIEGKSIVKEPAAVRQRIGFLTSEVKLEDFFTPDFLFDYFCDLHKVDDETKTKRKTELFERFGIDKFAHVKVANLSTGMKQKVSLVVSIAHDPDIVIFDEPTNGLDVITAKVVTDFLVELREKGKTVIISTHIFNLIEKVCDRVGIIIDGQMITCGSLVEVTSGRPLEDVFFDLYKERKGDEL